jgi:hypothetical protein
MNLFIIISALILFHGNYIYGVDTDELDGIDVLTTLKSTAPKCDLLSFVKTKNDYKSLIKDLNEYCSTSDSLKQYRILCHMLLYELTKACKLPSDSRPSQAVYTTDIPAETICKPKKIQLTNKWIWRKITNNGKKQIGVTAKGLCTKVTSDSNTIHLARFFYKIAPHVRQADLSSNQNKG